MRAVLYAKYGQPEVLEIREVEKPTPGHNEVLVRVHATTVSSGDARIRRADPFIVRLINGLTRPKKWPILGSDFAGEVEAVGKDVQLFMEGDAVFGSVGLSMGAHAEYVCLPEDGAIATKPANLSYDEAAAIPFGALASLHFLRKGNIASGQKVLIYGASGSLGTAAIQIAKHFGAEVTAVCSGANADLVRSLGADAVNDYTKQDLSQSDARYDIIFDTVGESPFAVCVQLLKEKGFYLRAVHMSLPSLARGLWTSMTSRKKVIGGVAAETRESMTFLKQLVETGVLKPVIDKCFPFDQIAQAHRHVDTGHKKGNVVVTLVPSA